jgi:hypothetical protein
MLLYTVCIIYYVTIEPIGIVIFVMQMIVTDYIVCQFTCYTDLEGNFSTKRKKASFYLASL